MPRIFLTHVPDMLQNYYGERAVAALRQLGEVRINDSGRVLDADALASAARGCEIVVSDRQTPGPAALFRQAPDLVAFLRCAVDIRNVDVAAASAAGILVTHATPGFAASVAEMTIGIMVDLARGISDSVLVYRQGSAPPARTGRQLRGSTLGIIGYGVIGRYLAPLGVALGMTVIVSDPHKQVSEPGIRQVPFETLLAEADFVVCLAVATEATENLMNEAAFARMKPTAFFINVSRGNLVDEAALARALDARRIAGAAMDVGRAADQMPSPALASRADVIATPHAAGLTPQAIEHQAFDTVNQVAELVAGRVPPNAVNAEAATRLARLRCAG
ncbi:MAG TPA: NAD(P)-dependent oxidoreductase [Xanthobacteraceae bacterium]|nr:NAD(P)-dependent oxidoreductase [Xanthobacteraceae bacterium]